MCLYLFLKPHHLCNTTFKSSVLTSGARNSDKEDRCHVKRCLSGCGSHYLQRFMHKGNLNKVGSANKLLQFSQVLNVLVVIQPK